MLAWILSCANLDACGRRAREYRCEDPTGRRSLNARDNDAKAFDSAIGTHARENGPCETTARDKPIFLNGWGHWRRLRHGFPRRHNNWQHGSRQEVGSGVLPNGHPYAGRRAVVQAIAVLICRRWSTCCWSGGPSLSPRFSSPADGAATATAGRGARARSLHGTLRRGRRVTRHFLPNPARDRRFAASGRPSRRGRRSAGNTRPRRRW